jgi:hypothetical protein
LFSLKGLLHSFLQLSFLIDKTNDDFQYGKKMNVVVRLDSNRKSSQTRSGEQMASSDISWGTGDLVPDLVPELPQNTPLETVFSSGPKLDRKHKGP